ncbi:MAG: cupin domain-containing protein [Desulfovibrio sp.]
MNGIDERKCTVEQLVLQYEMAEHPEGGFYKETYRAGVSVAAEALPESFTGSRNISTAIYYLLPEGAMSHLHRIASDEAWHFYLGGPLEIVEISPQGKLTKTILGQDVLNGQYVQHVVPAGSWFGARPVVGTKYSFVGCTVAPGFDFAEFEMAEREVLVNEFSDLKDIIVEMTE